MDATAIDKWMEFCHVNGVQLLRMMEAQGQPMSKSHLSGILSGSTTLGGVKSIVLSRITGIGPEILIRDACRNVVRSESPDSQGTRAKSVA